MARCISSVVVTLSLKPVKAVKDVPSMKSFVISLTFVSGCTLSHAVNFISTHPLVKGLLRDYDIINLTFNYSEL